MTTKNNPINQVGGIEKARGIVESSYKNAFFEYEDGLFVSVEDLCTAIEHHYYGQSEAEELAEYAELQRETMEGGASLKGNFSKALDRAEQLIASREFKVGDLVVLINSSDDSVFEYVEYSKRLNLHFFESKNNYGNTKLSNIRHATPEEIAAGHRIDSNDITDIRNHVSPSCEVKNG